MQKHGSNLQCKLMGLVEGLVISCLVLVLICLFDFILYVHSTIFQLCGTGLPGLNQY